MKKIFILSSIVLLGIYAIACDSTKNKCCNPGNANKNVVILQGSSQTSTQADDQGCVSVNGECVDNTILTTS